MSTPKLSRFPGPLEARKVGLFWPHSHGSCGTEQGDPDVERPGEDSGKACLAALADANGSFDVQRALLLELPKPPRLLPTESSSWTRSASRSFLPECDGRSHPKEQIRRNPLGRAVNCRAEDSHRYKLLAPVEISGLLYRRV
jgi:hypothetical protein